MEAVTKKPKYIDNNNILTLISNFFETYIFILFAPRFLILKITGYSKGFLRNRHKQFDFKKR